MWSRIWPGRAIAAAALATLLSCPASAQIEDSGLEQVDPWGVGYLGEAEPSFRTKMWRGARSEDLLTLMQAARTSGLTPAEHMLMRRLVLSPARAPGGSGSEALLAERARIAFELGEAAAAAGQYSRLNTPLDGMDTAAMAADLNLVLGNEATACSAVSQPDLEGAYWARLRAVCAALAGNTSGAELAMEMAQAQGVEDGWLSAAIYATSGATPDPPDARFDSGLSFAMSNRAVLKVTPDAVPQDRPDIAAAMARRKLMPPDVRVKAADLAAEAGLISADEYRTAYNSALAADGFEPVTALDRAIFISSDPMAPTAEKAEALTAALDDAAGNAARLVAVSGLLQSYIARLPLDAETTEDAFLFARANVAAGNLAEAIRWITPPEPEVEDIPAEVPVDASGDPVDGAAEAASDDAPAEASDPADDAEPENVSPGTPEDMAAADPDAPADVTEVDPEPAPEPEPPSFETAWMGALVVLADAEASPEAIDFAARTLIASAQTEAQEQEAARMLALWTMAGTPPPSDARYFLSAVLEAQGPPRPPGAALAVLAAARSGTAAEVVLSSLALTDGDPSALGTTDLALVLEALQDIGADDAARALALEATGYWKAVAPAGK